MWNNKRETFRIQKAEFLQESNGSSIPHAERQSGLADHRLSIIDPGHWPKPLVIIQRLHGNPNYAEPHPHTHNDLTPFILISRLT